MVGAGFDALEDAFSVIKNEHIFNIFNSSKNEIEEFNPSNADSYSQGQCAIVIERVFSRLYKYLQFKSTTGEMFRQHINMDSGYKYLSTDSLLKSDNPTTAYYSPDDEVDYLRYLAKVSEYVNGENPPNIGLTSSEETVLQKFCGILGKKAESWIYRNWDLCPLQADDSSDDDGLHALSPELLQRSSTRGVDDPSRRTLYVDFNLSRHMKWINDDIQSCIGADEGWTFTSNGLLRFDIQDPESDGWEVNLGGIKVNDKPIYSGDYRVEYDLVGFGRVNKGIPTYTTDSVVKSMDFDSGSQTLVLYAIWKPLGCVLKFNPGIGSGIMDV